jgi:[citrate (pro-3S)-lyase] ligase
VLPSSQFIISGVTLPEYFVKGEDPDAHVDASMDLEIFGKWIAPALGVHTRFVGEEPFDRVTLQYNNAMREILPRFGVELQVIPRKEAEGAPISASRVRKLLEEKNFVEIAKIVPETTLAYLKEKYGG